jgi:hypothetical protein
MDPKEFKERLNDSNLSLTREEWRELLDIFEDIAPGITDEILFAKDHL